jgi:hypothetical protein
MELSSSTEGSGITGFLLGDGFLAQTLLGIATVFALFYIMILFEYLYNMFSSIGGKNIELFPYTASSEDKQIVITQDPKKDPKAKQIPFSVNERTGVEFSYSYYLYVSPSTFDNTDTLATVFYKGYLTPWPLLGPGVFIRKNTNSMRIFLNAYENPYQYCDVENIPVSKWFHVALVTRRGGMEIYINGNLSKKLRFESGMPYQNFQDVILFNQSSCTLRGSTTPALGEETYEVRGVFKGNLSALSYFPYALSYTEINGLMNAGPSKKVLSDSKELPPYFADQWWTTSYSQTTV